MKTIIQVRTRTFVQFEIKKMWMQGEFRLRNIIWEMISIFCYSLDEFQRIECHDQQKLRLECLKPDYPITEFLSSRFSIMNSHQYWNNLPTVLTWLPAIFFCLDNWRSIWLAHDSPLTLEFRNGVAYMGLDADFFLNYFVALVYRWFG